VATQFTDIEYLQEGGLSTLSPAFGFEITDRISCGVVMNLWDSALVPGNEWKEIVRRRVRVQGQVFGTSFTGFGRLDTYTEYEDFQGTNYTFGVLAKPTERLSLGAVYHTKFAADLTRTETNRIYLFPQALAVTRRRDDIRMEWPSAFGLGAAYRFRNDKLTLTLDVTRREWDQFVLVDEHAGSLMNTRRSPITNLPKQESYHKPTYTVRFGGEYVFVDPARPKQRYLPSVRAGLFYDPEPASGRDDKWWGITRGDGAPDDYFGATLGLGLLVGSRVNIDAAYEYRWGNDVRRDTWAGQPMLERGFSEDVEQHIFYLSTVVYF
jgi:long-subunit fatty acid transport protein